jgi:hypothetical protein
MGVFGAVKIGSRKMTLFSVGCFLVFLAVCVVMLRTGAPDTVTLGGEVYPLSVEDDGDIAAFLTACGCPDAECVTDDQITVPKNWNAAYEAYQQLQQEQGFDLVPYKGKDARLLVYVIDGGADDATVLVSGGRIIAAHRGGMVQGEAMKPLIEGESSGENHEGTTG